MKIQIFKLNLCDFSQRQREFARVSPQQFVREQARARKKSPLSVEGKVERFHEPAL